MKCRPNIESRGLHHKNQGIIRVTLRKILRFLRSHHVSDFGHSLHVFFTNIAHALTRKVLSLWRYVHHVRYSFWFVCLFVQTDYTFITARITACWHIFAVIMVWCRWMLWSRLSTWSWEAFSCSLDEICSVSWRGVGNFTSLTWYLCHIFVIMFQWHTNET